MKYINKKREQLITMAILIVLFIVVLCTSNKNQINKLSASVPNLKMKNNIAIINKDCTKKHLKDKLNNQNIRVISNSVDINDTTRMKTGDLLVYDNNNYQVAILGDANKDGNVDGADISRVYKIYRNIITNPTSVEKVASDANEDDNIDGADISRTYKIYRGMYVPEEEINQNITHTVTFNSNGGSNVESILKYENEPLGTLPTTTKNYHSFTGWYTASTGGTKITSTTRVTKDVTYYAQWTPNTYKITYNANGGINAPSQQSYQYATSGTINLTSNIPTRVGYKFLGWSTSSTATSPSYTPNQQWNKNNANNYTLYAVWDTYNILFIGNSKTFYNHMPKLFQNMAIKGTNTTPYVFMITAKGKTLEDHAIDRKTVIENQVKSRRYDYIILQEQTETSEDRTQTSKGINDIKNIVRNTTGSKSTNAIFINNVIWRELYSKKKYQEEGTGQNVNTTYKGLCKTNTSSSLNQAQNNADTIAINLKQTGDIVVLSGRQLFDYECSIKVLDVGTSQYSLYRSDLNHPQPQASYLEAGLIYSTIYGYPSSNTTINVTGWNCTENHYSNGQNSWDNPTHTWKDSTQQNLWNYIRGNRNYIK